MVILLLDHYTTNKIKQSIWSLKKNLQAIRKNNKDALLLFFDESRFGTNSKLGYGWFPKGSRTAMKVKLGFKNFYVYSVIDINSGKDFSILASNVNTAFMNHFLSELSKQLKGKKAILVMDCAGWHKAKDLSVPENIRIVYLPPYSPELNPVERLWRYIKSHTIKNKIYDTIEDLEEAVCNFLVNLNDSVVKKLCAINYVR